MADSRCNVCPSCIATPQRPCALWVNAAVARIKAELESPGFRAAMERLIPEPNRFEQARLNHEAHATARAARHRATKLGRKMQRNARSNAFVRIRKAELARMRQDIADYEGAAQTIFMRCRCGRIKERGIVCPGACRFTDGD